MRVAWVHPSWRDLVIDHLSSDQVARERFLRGCSVHGALLALSRGGGQAGDRQVPLLKHDADWDALTDRVYALVAELETAELVGLIDALAPMLRDLKGTPNEPEANALANSVLARCRSLWNSQRVPIPLLVLEAWLALATRLTPRPEPPAIVVTWAELVPAAAPELADRVGLERFADWLALAQLLLEYDPNRLAGLGFPGHSRRFCEQFLEALEHDGAPTDIGHAIRALTHMPRLIPGLTARANSLRFRLRNLEDLSAPPTFSTAPETVHRTGHLDVQRVLKDL